MLGLGFGKEKVTPGPESDCVPLLDLEALVLLRGGRASTARSLAHWDHRHVGVQSGHGSEHSVPVLVLESEEGNEANFKEMENLGMKSNSRIFCYMGWVSVHDVYEGVLRI
jgi:hypothetical protein